MPYAFWLGVLRSKLWRAEVVADENVRLDAELQARLDELRESRARIVEAGYAERRRVERDLHDGAQQRLVALALELQLVRSKLESDPAAAAELLEVAADELTGATQELRELARGLHPPVLADRGLVPALEALASRATVPVAVEADGGRRGAGGDRDRGLLRRLGGAHEHRPARRREPGRGARLAARWPASRGNRGRRGRRRRPDGGSGLRGLADRVGALDGSLELDSEAGAGTTRSRAQPAGGAALG